jgi:outer membrane receptor protein involved in Fe transport
LSELIQYRPGSSVSSLSRNDANWGTSGGIGTKYSTFMLNGIPIDAFIDPMSLDADAFSRIEVQRGPASVLYPNYLSQDFAGNQSPLAGTINLILKDRIVNPLTSVSSSYGSYNTLNNRIFHQGNNEKDLHYFFGVSNEISDYTDYGIENSWLNMHKNPEYTKTKLFGGITIFSGNEDKQKFNVFFNKTIHTGDAGRVYRGFDNKYGTLQFGYDLKINKEFSLSANLGYRNYDRTWQESNYFTIDSLLSNNGAFQTIIPVDIRINYTKGKHNLTAGTDFQSADYSTYTSPVNFSKQLGNKSKATQIGFYAQDEIRFSKLIARAGIRYNMIQNSISLINGGTPGKSLSNWNVMLWSAGLKYKGTKKINLYANAGNSFVSPGLKAIGGTIKLENQGVVGFNGQLPNPDLKPESGLGIDFGSDIKLSALSISLRGFYTQIADAIIDVVVSSNPSQTKSINVGGSSSTGFEAELKTAKLEFEINSKTTSLQAFANYTYIKTATQNDSNLNQNGNEIPFSPSQILNAGIDIALPFGTVISPYININDGFYDSNDKTSRKKFIPGSVLNINLSQQIIKTDSYKISLFTQFYNVTNNQYELPWQFKNTGFAATGGLKVSF